MKREAINHTKMRKLARKLRVRNYVAVGIMESLWNLTAREAPCGDLGRLTNEDIALGLDYPDEGVDALIDALLESDWLDTSEEYRLIVHDWSEHAENSTHMYLMQHRMLFADGCKPYPNKHLRIPGSSKKSRRADRMRAAGNVGRILAGSVYDRDGWTCRECDSGDDLTIDHVIPVSVGGKSTMENLQVLCRPCNSSKKDRI